MSDNHTVFSRPSQLLIDRSLTLCKSLLRMENSFYPFAAIYENGRIGCLFSEDFGVENPGEMQILEHSYFSKDHSIFAIQNCCSD